MQRRARLPQRTPCLRLEIGFNLPAFIVACIVTTVLVIGIKESARFNAAIVTVKVAVVLFVIVVGLAYVNPKKLGVRQLVQFRSQRVRRIGAGAAYILLCLHRI